MEEVMKMLKSIDEGFSVFYILLSIIVKVAASPPNKSSLFDAPIRPKGFT